MLKFLKINTQEFRVHPTRVVGNKPFAPSKISAFTEGERKRKRERERGKRNIKANAGHLVICSNISSTWCHFIGLFITYLANKWLNSTGIGLFSLLFLFGFFHLGSLIFSYNFSAAGSTFSLSCCFSFLFTVHFLLFDLDIF